MKSFFKTVAATMVGIAVMGIIGIVLFIVALLSMIASTSDTVSLEDNSVLVINLNGSMDERAEEDPLGQLLGKAGVSVGLDNMLTAIEKAEKNDKVKGIYIETGKFFMCDSYASAQALRRQLAKFKKSGKFIVAYGEDYSQAAYYIASVADKVYVNPIGNVNWRGLTSQHTYYKDVLAKFGVKVQVFKVGTYKSYAEPYTSTEMSEANRAQTLAYINGIWNTVTSDVAASRKVSVAQLNAIADSLPSMRPTSDLVKNKLVDGLLYNDQVKAEVKKLLKQDADEAVHQISVGAMNAAVPDSYEGDQIAVYYAYGDIVSSEVEGMRSDHMINSSVVCPDLEKLTNDDNVKAVVIRINSGGGSAYASEQIWHQIMELKKKKPVVVSMGGMAASGGYYMSAPANWIVAEPTTLTGSIGIFGMIPDGSGLLQEKLGLRYDGVSTNKHSDFTLYTRPFSSAFTPEESRLFQSSIERGYALFRQRVAEGRKMKVEEVEKIAQGHVWLGQDAIKIKLVDQLGYLDDAVAKAAQLAKLSDYHTEDYPAKLDWKSALMDKVSGGNYLDEALQSQLGIYFQPVALLMSLQQQDAIQARVPYSLSIY